MRSQSQLDTIPDRWAAQIRKGSLEMATLASLWDGKRYGLEILRDLGADAALAITEGTLYPLLSRLKDDGLLSSEWVEAEAGHPRKYYTLTEKGRKRLVVMAHAWSSFSQGIDRLLVPVLQHNLEKAS